MLLLSFQVNAQKKLNKAREYKANFEYAKAIPLYLEYFENKNPKVNDVRDIANCYLMINDVKSAQDWLSRYNTFYIYSHSEMLNYANALKASGDYNEAMKQYLKFQEIFPSKADNMATWLIACVDGKKWTKKPQNYLIENVEQLNSENSDYGLFPYKNGFLYSTDKKSDDTKMSSEEIFGWTGNPYLKLYSVSNINEASISNTPEKISKINSSFHNGSGVYDYQNDVLYYTITKEKKKKTLPADSDPTSWNGKETTEQYVNRMEIYTAKLVNDKWEDISPFKYNNSDVYSVGHPALSLDANILYFASSMPGGYGSSDIYYCIRLPDGTWDKPINCGNIINTEGKEAFPVIDQTGTLYYSSDGQSGMGGLDIFETHGSTDNWSVPENLKAPINSPKDDFSPYFNQSGLSGYLSSNRDGGKGEDDIYYFSKGLVIIGKTFAKVYDNSLVPLEDVEIIITNFNNNNISSNISDNYGLFIERANCSNTYEFNAHKKGYFMQSKTLETVCNSGNDTMYVELVLDQILENKSYVVNNIYYDFDKWYIRTDAAKELNKLVAVLEDNPEIDIELGSHTDSRGTDVYNQKLSQKRAESAVEYIISQGIKSDRITAKGYGESKPAIDCKFCTEEEHQINRRTEFTVTKIRYNNFSLLD
ncbi:MAG: hypothetical protein A2033_16780 [Bacteroidetes bacterium GWA2_31_9]|nr:MAG: hypothetical protein A2033_16780 [Bacteroidetes bacterium GWA2_31_9]